MNTLVFTTHDITPEHWADFGKTAGSHPADQNEEVHGPYVLVYSPSQQDLDRTERISATVKTQFSLATWEQMKSSFIALSGPNSRTTLTFIFLILDQQSTEDRKVIIIEKGMELVTPEGDDLELYPFLPRDDLTKMTVWRKYRVPFEEALLVQFGIEGFCDPEKGEQYFEEEVEREVCLEESDSEESDSEETDPEEVDSD